MTTTYNVGVFRKAGTATKPNPGTAVPVIVMIPEGVFDFSIYVKASAAATGKVEESFSTGEQIQTGTGVEWLSVTGTLDSVGATAVRYDLGVHTPVALRFSSLVDNQTAAFVVTGKLAV